MPFIRDLFYVILFRNISPNRTLNTNALQINLLYLNFLNKLNGTMICWQLYVSIV